MRVFDLGDGDPAVAVVGAVHGDEPCGPRAIERLRVTLEAPVAPVRLIVANERALAVDRRYIDEDLNRIFPGVGDAQTHEGVLAAQLREAVVGCTVLSLHATQSTDRPFALVDRITDPLRPLLAALPLAAVVETAPFSSGRLIANSPVIELECGLQHSQHAAENAYWLSVAFLAATGVIATPPSMPAAVRERLTAAGPQTPVYSLTGEIAKPDAARYEVLVENFHAVDPGTTYARADTHELTADGQFYPVLMSAGGYRDILGYTARRVGDLS
ncbi:MAG: succinylglutamate desuccinylase/aspartoacylase family protein [Haloquadratum sp.]|nr:succinylglutamate desuccinylase/aspartoacylase family protein [Haloquadratum sp.]